MTHFHRQRLLEAIIKLEQGLRLLLEGKVRKGPRSPSKRVTSFLFLLINNVHFIQHPHLNLDSHTLRISVLIPESHPNYSPFR
jgi:hypothetical protein